MLAKTEKSGSQPGQGLVEYSLIILLVAVVVTAAVVLTGPQISNTFSRINQSIPVADGGGGPLPAGQTQTPGETATPETSPTPGGTPSPEKTATLQPTPLPNGRLSILSDFQQRILNYYAQNGRWPRTWGKYAYSDIGLDRDDWEDPVEGIYWGPHGSNIGLANKRNDNLQVYVTDLEGNTLHLYDGWNIWCEVITSQCYYHTIAPGNEVDINTLQVITTQDANGRQDD